MVAVPKPCPGYAGNISAQSISFGTGSIVYIFLAVVVQKLKFLNNSIHSPR
jgi:hypothetical protein